MDVDDIVRLDAFVNLKREDILRGSDVDKSDTFHSTAGSRLGKPDSKATCDRDYSSLHGPTLMKPGLQRGSRSPNLGAAEGAPDLAGGYPAGEQLAVRQVAHVAQTVEEVQRLAALAAQRRERSAHPREAGARRHHRDMGDSRIALECVEQESVLLVEEARLWQGRARGASGFEAAAAVTTAQWRATLGLM